MNELKCLSLNNENEIDALLETGFSTDQPRNRETLH